MTVANNKTTGSRRHRWRRVLVWFSGGLLLLLILLYFVVTSGEFFKAVVLPKVGQSLKAEVTAGDVSFSPFSQVVLRDLIIQGHEVEPLLKAKEVRVRYDLLDVLRGRPEVKEIAILSPVVRIIKEPDGTSNLDPISQALAEGRKREGTFDASKLRLGRVRLSDASFLVIKKHEPAGQTLRGVTNFNLALDNVRATGSARLSLEGDFLAENQALAAASNGVMQARFAGSFDCALSSGLAPEGLAGATRFLVQETEGAFTNWADVSAILECNATAREVKQFLMRLEQGDAVLAELRAAGPLDLSRGEGRLAVELESVDETALNLFGSPRGIEFSPTRIGATGVVELAKGGAAISLEGDVRADRLSVTRAGSRTPEVNLTFDYHFGIDRDNQTALLHILSLRADEGEEPLLRAGIDQPMQISLGGEAPSAEAATFSLVLTNFDLAEWRPLAGTNWTSGRLNAAARVESRDRGQRLAARIDAHLAHLNLPVGSNMIADTAAELSASAEMTNGKYADLSRLQLGVRQKDRVLFELSASGFADQENSRAGLKGTSRIFVAECLQAAGLGGVVETNSALPKQVSLDFDGGRDQGTFELRNLTVNLGPTGRATNEFHLSGQAWRSSLFSLQGNFKLTADSLDITPYYDWLAAADRVASTNQTGPGPLLEPGPIRFPLRNSSFEVAIERLFLRELAVSDWKARLEVDGGRVKFDPFDLTLNGAPLRAKVDLNLAERGYKYVLKLSADRIPLEPLANTFLPEKRGAYKGEILANAAIQGTGLTGANLRKHLSGEAGFSFTNAEIQIVQGWLRGLLEPVVAFLGTPDLVQRPLTWAAVDLRAGRGRIDVQELALQSDAFLARTRGEIPIADDLKQSPINGWPVELQVRRALLQRLGLTLRSGTNETYFALPANFFQVTGTLGEPKADINKRALAGTALETIAEKFIQDDTAGAILRGLGEILRGRTNAPPSSTNAPATNPPARFNPLDLLRRKSGEE